MMGGLKETFATYFIKKRWGRVENMPLPHRDDRAGEVLFGIINLMAFISALALVPFLAGLVLSVFLAHGARALLWQAIIYGVLGIWGVCGAIAYPAAIAYHARYGLWRHVWFLVTTVLAIAVVACLLIVRL